MRWRRRSRPGSTPEAGVGRPPMLGEADADALAATAHAGQVDKAGQPYIDHPRRVAARLTHPRSRVTALLHDVLEDTELTAEDLAEHGAPEQVLVALGLLTRRSDEDYDRFIGRIAASRDPLAIDVKLADLADNTDPGRGDAAKHLQARYGRAISTLEEARVGLGPVRSMDDLGSAVLAPRCARCGRETARLELVPPGRRADGWEAVRDDLRRYDDPCAYRKRYRGPGGSSGDVPDAVTRADAELIAEVARRRGPLRAADIERLGLYDRLGICAVCNTPWCESCWRVSSTGFGTCPKGHGQSLDPHWSPD